jgi:hypothetical protein
LPAHRPAQAHQGVSVSTRKQVVQSREQVRAGHATKRSVEVNRSQAVVVRHPQHQARSVTVTHSRSQTHTQASRGSISPRPAAHAHQQPAHRPAAEHGHKSGGGQGHHDNHHR